MYIWDETRTVNNLKKDIENRFPETEIKKIPARVRKYFTMKSLILAQDER